MKPKLQVYVLEPIPTLEVGRGPYTSDFLMPTYHVAKRFLYVMEDPYESIAELAYNLKVIFAELYPHLTRPCIDLIQDADGMDLDRNFLVRDVFRDRSVARMILTQPTDKDEQANFRAALALVSRMSAEQALAQGMQFKNAKRHNLTGNFPDEALDDNYEEVIEITARRINQVEKGKHRIV